jgi:tRNA(fMet)-specific endonuclease VapC
MTRSGVDAKAHVVLDTSAYSHLRRADPRLLDAVAGARRVTFPAIVLGELDAAFRLGRREADNRRALAELLAEPTVDVVDVTADVARRYGQIFAALRQAGTPVPVNDIWIAAATMTCGGHLLTFDGDFDRVEGLLCTIYSVTAAPR